MSRDDLYGCGSYFFDVLLVKFMDLERRKAPLFGSKEKHFEVLTDLYEKLQTEAEDANNILLSLPEENRQEEIYSGLERMYGLIILLIQYQQSACLNACMGMAYKPKNHMFYIEDHNSLVAKMETITPVWLEYSKAYKV